ncbi:Pr6Pr family membrane protein [Serinibacter arcticus]|uniref:Pr6Pr family membrane protein n=1 Tax=Serinibacter arcticus TaxID=1655435 RepID=UPI0011B25CDA|nr:Pr6Pr family membrane protein [Serinibacter arcticus]
MTSGPRPGNVADALARTRARTRARTLVAVALAGVAAQMLATGRPLVDLVYFTVQSALLLALGTALALVPRLRGSTALATVRGAATVGSVLAGVVYALAIAPGEGQGRWLLDEPVAAVASVLQHLVLPVLAVVVLRRDVLARSPRPFAAVARRASVWIVWPACWAIGMGLLITLGAATLPYPFLDPSVVGTPRVLVSGAILLAVLWSLGVLLQVRSPRRGAETLVSPRKLTDRS